MAQAGPSIVILGGPNGAGKTTAARTVLADTLSLMTFVNADAIAQGLSGFDPESSAIEAGRIMLRRLQSLAEQRADFAFETTLSGRSYVRLLTTWRQAGYTVHLVYFWLASAELAVARVAERVRQGGHGIPVESIRQRYGRSIENFFHLYRPLASSWDLFDNSLPGTPRLVAQSTEAGPELVLDPSLWDLIRKGARDG